MIATSTSIANTFAVTVIYQSPKVSNTRNTKNKNVNVGIDDGELDGIVVDELVRKA